jgi:hypothetical protein
MEKALKKIVVSNRLFFKCNDDVALSKLEKGLTYTLETKGKGGRTAYKYLCRFGRVAADTYWVPQGKLEYLKDCLGDFDYQLIDKRVSPKAYIPKPKFTLRPDQQEIYDEFNESCIINGKPG